jgi:hypothetical protein
MVLMLNSKIKTVVNYISSTYGIKPNGLTEFDVDEDMCWEIVNDIEKRFRRHLNYIEMACL